MELDFTRLNSLAFIAPKKPSETLKGEGEYKTPIEAKKPLETLTFSIAFCRFFIYVFVFLLTSFSFIASACFILSRCFFFKFIACFFEPCYFFGNNPIYRTFIVASVIVATITSPNDYSRTAHGIVNLPSFN